MAMRKLTFTIPEELAVQFLKRVPARERSNYVAAAISEKLRQKEQRLIDACKSANRDPDILALEQDFEALADGTDTLKEPWVDVPSR